MPSNPGDKFDFSNLIKNPNGQPPPALPTTPPDEVIEAQLDQPMPAHVSIEQVGAGSVMMVRLKVIQPNVKFKVMFDGDAAVRFGQQLIKFGKASKSGLIISEGE